LAATTAVQWAFGNQATPAGALLAAGDRLRDHRKRTEQPGDAVMVVAVARGEPDLDGFEVAWVGDCRAYELRGNRLVQLTVDHARTDVMRTVASANPSSIGTVSTADQRSRLVLTSKGVHQRVSHDDLTTLIAGTEDVRRCAHLITVAAVRRTGSQNATALVVDRVDPV